METIRGFGIGLKAGLPLLIFMGFMLLTDPQKLPPVLLIVPFGLVFIAVMALVLGVIEALRQESGKVLGQAMHRPRLLAALLAAFPTLLLVLQSIGQLSVWDIATATALLVLAYIYVSRSNVTFFR
jgi:hypothetical protein